MRLLILSCAIAIAAAARAAVPAAPAACSARPSLSITGAPYALTGALCPVHDPCLARDADGSLHVFSTDIGASPATGYIAHRCSADGAAFALCGAVFAALPRWLLARLPGLAGLWAPDVSFDRASGRWLLYYAASAFGSQDSVIGLAATDSLSRPAWRDLGPVLASRAGDAYNAIDPSRSFFGDLAFGSFWGGLYAVPLAANGSAAPPPPPPPRHLAQRASPDALEAASLLHVARADGAAEPWLLASFDLCCRGAASTYNVRAGRAGNASGGAFLDAAGVALLAGGGTRLLGGGHGYAAAGGQSPLRTADAAPPPAAQLLPLALHAYDAVRGDPWLQIVQLDFSGAWVRVAD